MITSFFTLCLSLIATVLLLAIGSGVFINTSDQVMAQQGGSVATDRAALVALYDATGGANWTTKTNWKTSAALNTWHGVATDSNGRVSSVYIPQNNLIGTIPSELGNLSALEWLNLRDNQLSGSIPSSLGNLSDLEVLDLRSNQLSGSIPSSLGNLSALESLILWGNQLSGSIPSSLENLSALESLNLWGNQLSGSIPSSLGNLSALELLNLRDNQLSGSIPSSLGNLSDLQWLILGGNQLSGSIPSSLGNLSDLTELSLGGNQLSGPIPSSLGNLSDLQWLILGGNQLSGSIPSSLGNLSDLRLIDIGFNQLSGSIPSSLGNLSDLQWLILGGNQLSGSIPSSLGNLSALELLNLRDNQLSGSIPSSLGNLSALESLNLWGNQLSGSIPSSLGNLSALEPLNLGSNQLSGPIPTWLGNLSDLTELSLGGNQLSGSIPSSLGNLSDLKGLHLWGNQLSGSIPSSLGNLSALESLNLGFNQLSGSIPSSLGNLSDLQWLMLGGNQLSGSIPSSLGNLSALELLNLRDNQLSGPIPSSLGNLSRLQHLRLEGNSLSGIIPSSINQSAFTSIQELKFTPSNTGLCASSSSQATWINNLNATGRTIKVCIDLSLEVAKRYAPVLRMHDNETVYPRSVDSMIDNAVLMNADGQEVQSQPNPLTFTYIASRSDRGEYMDLWNVDPPSWYGTYGSYETADEALREEDYPLTVYSRYSVDNVDNQGTFNIQYWMFYPLDRGHEGDWEMIQLTFDVDIRFFDTNNSGDVDYNELYAVLAHIYNNELFPARTLYSAHGGSNHECWSTHQSRANLTIFFDSHPEVFVARGSHANYHTTVTQHDVTTDNGDWLVPPGVTRPPDTTGFSYSIVEIGQETSWLRFPGRWGEYRGIPTRDGPVGPAFQEYYRNPGGWWANDDIDCASTNAVYTFGGLQKVGRHIVTILTSTDISKNIHLEFSPQAIDSLDWIIGGISINITGVATTSSTPSVESLNIVATGSGDEVVEIVDISMSQDLGGAPVSVCLPYPANSQTSKQIVHYDESLKIWTNLPTETNVRDGVGYACAETDSFSLFALLSELTDAEIAIERSTRLVSELRPNVGSEIVVGGSDRIKLSIDAYGVQDILDNGLLDGKLKLDWSVSGNILGDFEEVLDEIDDDDIADEREVLFTAPDSPGRYTIEARLQSPNCAGSDEKNCVANFTIRVKRSAAVTSPTPAPVNPTGSLPTILTDPDGNQYEVFTPVEGGEFFGDGVSVSADSGAVPNGEVIGVRADTKGEASNVGQTHQRATLAGQFYDVVAVDSEGRALNGYLLDAPVTVCLPLPKILSSNISDLAVVSLGDDGSFTMLGAKVRLSDDGVKICAGVSELSARVAAAHVGAPSALPTATPMPPIEEPDTGGNAPLNVSALVLLLILGSAIAVLSLVLVFPAIRK